MPLEDAVWLEPLEPERTRRRDEGLGGRSATRPERIGDPGRTCGGRDARGRHQTDQLPTSHRRPAGLRLKHDPLHQHVRRRGAEVDDVRRDLDGAAQLQPERLHPGEPARRLANRSGHVLRDLERPQELDVEREEWRPHADEHRARVEQRGPVRRYELARIDPSLELAWPSPAVERRAAPVGERPIQEHRRAELVAEPPSDGARDGLRSIAVFRPHGHDRDDVGGTDARMHPVVAPQVDRLPRNRDAGDEPVLEAAVVPDEREHRAVVIGVDVRVEEPRASRPEGRSDGLDDGGVTPFRDVRHGLERTHPPTLETVREPTAPAYYDRRAPEYDDWYVGLGLFAERERPGFDAELAQVTSILAALPAARTLDVACGTGFLTQHLRGDVTGLDASGRMLAIASGRIGGATFVQGDALALPFPDDSYDRVVSGHFYGHLDETQRTTFLGETRRVAHELVLLDASRRHSPVAEEWSERHLNDGTVWEVYKRWFEPQALLDEIGGSGGEVLHAGDWFVVVRSAR